MKIKITLTLLFYVLMTCSLMSQTTLISQGSSWNYYDAGNEPSDQGSLDWNDNTYDDNSWSSGNAHLGYGDGDETTMIANNPTYTAYFRQSFNVSNPGLFANLDIQLTYDDGAVIYLNGIEVLRVNMPTGSINYNTFASSTSNDNAIFSTSIANTLNTGSNQLSVEIHQTSSSSSDISFDFEMTGLSAGAVIVERGPYLQKSTPSSMIVRWRTDTPTESVVHYGTTEGSLTSMVSDLTLKTEHVVEISGLSANTVYYYDLANSANVQIAGSPQMYFKTAPNSGTVQPLRAWVLGDCGTVNNDQRAVRDAYNAYNGNDHTDMILFLGDNAYNDGTDNEYQVAIFENMYEDNLRNTVAWSCLGNHDGHSANSNAQSGPYYDIFTFPKNGESGGVNSGTEAYYSFDHGNVHFISLESYETDRSVGGSMYNWCEADLQNATADWIVAFWHHPPYSKGSHNSDSESNLIDMRENFLPLLESHGVDMVFSGHSHSYERSYFLNGHYGNSDSFDPIDHTIGTNGDGNGQLDGNGAYEKEITGSDEGKGAVYITAGSSGKTSGGSLDHEAMYYSVAQLGSCVLEINNDTLSVKFLRETGSIDDYFSIIKSLNCTPGGACDDLSPCTSNDVYDSNCACVGIPDLDSDGDGVCDADDQCPGIDDGIIGTTCDDGDVCTSGETYDNNCNCSGGTFQDSDGDGVCDGLDVCPGGDDNIDYDGDGIPDACDCYASPVEMTIILDNYPEETSWTLTSSGSTIASGGTYGSLPNGSTVTETFNLIPGDYTYTINDSYGDGICCIEGIGSYSLVSESSTIVSGGDFVYSEATEFCIEVANPCASAGGDTDDDGVCGDVDQCPGQDDALIGTVCDDGDACTTGETYDNNCNCSGGTFQDADGDGVCDANDQCPGQDDALIGTSCDDGDACTTNDVYGSNCSCAGVPEPDSDGDGVCDALDQCPGVDDALIGTTCDDGDACTTGEIYDGNCNCSGGTFQDTDGDGVCDANDQCPGQDDALIGTACDDGDPCTVNDVYDSNCGCVGTQGSDSDGDGVCDALDQCPGVDDALIGTTCDDGDACTIGETYDGTCNCSGGTYQDSDGDGVCDADDICPGGDDTVDNNNNGIPDECECSISVNTFPYGQSFESGIGDFTQDGGDDLNWTRDSGGTPSSNTGPSSGGDGSWYMYIEASSPNYPSFTAGLITPCFDLTNASLASITFQYHMYGTSSDMNLDVQASVDGGSTWTSFIWRQTGNQANQWHSVTLDLSGYTGTFLSLRFLGTTGETWQGDIAIDDILVERITCLVGSACDDGDACTSGDVYDGGCTCTGVPEPDSDGDGVCDALDQCPGVDDALIGTTCDDGDACTTGETYDGNCNCSGGTFQDTDGDGVCDADDICPGGDDTVDDNNNGIPDACEGCTYASIDFNNFEGGWGIWNDGGSDCRRSSSDASYANSGTYCIRLRDNTSSSVMTTDDLNLNTYDELTVNFSYITVSMDNSNEDFWLQISTNGGTSYTTVEEWNLNDEFQNNVRYNESVAISGPFTSNTRLRFRCDASANGDRVYIDDVEIKGCDNAALLTIGSNATSSFDQSVLSIKRKHDNDEDLWTFNVYPNPFSDEFKIELQRSESAFDQNFDVDIYDISGKLVLHEIYDGKRDITIRDCCTTNQIYFVRVTGNNRSVICKIIKLQ